MWIWSEQQTADIVSKFLSEEIPEEHSFYTRPEDKHRDCRWPLHKRWFFHHPSHQQQNKNKDMSVDEMFYHQNLLLCYNKIKPDRQRDKERGQTFPHNRRTPVSLSKQGVRNPLPWSTVWLVNRWDGFRISKISIRRSLCFVNPTQQMRSCFPNHVTALPWAPPISSVSYSINGRKRRQTHSLVTQFNVIDECAVDEWGKVQKRFDFVWDQINEFCDLYCQSPSNYQSNSMWRRSLNQKSPWNRTNEQWVIEEQKLTTKEQIVEKCLRCWSEDQA
jgi:hypothetical protein